MVALGRVQCATIAAWHGPSSSPCAQRSLHAGESHGDVEAYSGSREPTPHLAGALGGRTPLLTQSPDAGRVLSRRRRPSRGARRLVRKRERGATLVGTQTSSARPQQVLPQGVAAGRAGRSHARSTGSRAGFELDVARVRDTRRVGVCGRSRGKRSPAYSLARPPASSGARNGSPGHVFAEKTCCSRTSHASSSCSHRARSSAFSRSGSLKSCLASLSGLRRRTCGSLSSAPRFARRAPLRRRRGGEGERETWSTECFCVCGNASRVGGVYPPGGENASFGGVRALPDEKASARVLPHTLIPSLDTTLPHPPRPSHAEPAKLHFSERPRFPPATSSASAGGGARSSG